MPRKPFRQQLDFNVAVHLGEGLAGPIDERGEHAQFLDRAARELAQQPLPQVVQDLGAAGITGNRCEPRGGFVQHVRCVAWDRDDIGQIVQASRRVAGGRQPSRRGRSARRSRARRYAPTRRWSGYRNRSRP